MPYLVPSGWTTRNLREKAEPAAERHPQSDPSGNLTKEVLVPGDWTTKNIRVKAEPVASALLVLRLAFSCSTRGKRAYVLSALRTPLAHANATARACNQERGLACRALDSAQGKPCSVALLGLAFTMAEILLSLTIIGVVAAITLPSLTGNINERTWNTQRKALYARMSQAVSLMPALNGYGTLTEETDSAGSTSIVDTAAETFVTAGLSKVLKINNICDNEHLADCGIPKTFINLKGSKVDVPEDLVALNSFFTSGSMINGDFFISYSQQNTKAVAFETVNGESLITYYNPKCRYRVDRSSAGFSQPDMCANFIYDLNGTKGPNTVGKDVGFITVMYPADSSVFMPMPYTKTAGYATSKNANKLCQTIFGDDARLPNRNELAAVAFNSLLTGEYSANDSYWTSTPTGAFNNKGYYVYNIKSGLYRTDYGPDTPIPIICIKK